MVVNCFVRVVDSMECGSKNGSIRCEGRFFAGMMLGFYPSHSTTMIVVRKGNSIWIEARCLSSYSEVDS